jgi:hypothetical protein
MNWNEIKLNGWSVRKLKKKQNKTKQGYNKTRSAKTNITSPLPRCQKDNVFVYTQNWTLEEGQGVFFIIYVQ